MSENVSSTDQCNFSYDAFLRDPKVAIIQIYFIHKLISGE